MASTFPTSLDVFTNPIATNPLTAPSHAQQHSDINDAVEALEAKVAIGATVLGTYTAFVPTINITLGNGTLSAFYCRVNNFVHYYGKVVFGTTTIVNAGGMSLTVPINIDAAQSGSVGGNLGNVSCRDASASITVPGASLTVGSATTIYLEQFNANNIYAQNQAITAAIPFTWATTDVLSWNLYYKAA